MNELGRKVFDEVNKWLSDSRGTSATDLIEKTIETMEDMFNKQCNDLVRLRIEQIAMQRAKDINGIPVRTLIAKDIVTTMIGGKPRGELESAEVARVAVDMTDELLKALNQRKENQSNENDKV